MPTGVGAVRLNGGAPSHEPRCGYPCGMLQFDLLPQDGFLLVHLAGLVSPEAWEKGMRELQEAIKGAQSDRLVIDLYGLVGWLGEPERRAVGALMATRLAQMKRVALVIHAHKISGVVEEEAQRKGLDLRLFSSHEEAAGWVVS
jgi:hypothetical protein